MSQMIPKSRTEVNRIRCITRNNRTLYSLRIEDPAGHDLTPFVDVPKERARWALQLSVIPGQDPKEDVISLEAGEEDYRVPIRNEHILRQRLYGTENSTVTVRPAETIPSVDPPR